MHISFPLLAAAACLAALLASAPAQAQEYPSRPVKVIVPFSPGGAVDGPMRVIAQELGKRMGQQVVVENKPGAGATIGSEIVARAAPDGYTLLLASQTNAISASLYSKLAYDPIDDFAPISLIGEEPGVLVVNPALPVKTFQEFIAYVKERPGQVDYASSGNGSGQHLFAALLASSTGLKMNHIPYKGSGQATTDLLGGQVMVSIPGTAGMVGHIKAGKLRALAVTTAKRSEELPDVPTVGETVPGYEASAFFGFGVPHGTPKEIVDLLNREINLALKDPTMLGKLKDLGGTPIPGSAADFGKLVADETAKWEKVVHAANLSID